ncbi:MAG TPA: hypothetical protein VFQ52_05925 [Rhizomicrobium sp.]|nr:hypothetical protein [Rhizomicrobium sp.]
MAAVIGRCAAKVLRRAAARQSGDETDAALHLIHDRRGDAACAKRAAFKRAIDFRRIGEQPTHFLGYRLKLRDGKVSQRILEAGELLAGKLGDHRIAILIGQRGIDVQQIFRFRAVLQFLLAGGQRQRVGLGALDLAGNGIGVIGQVYAAGIALVRLGHFLGAVA